jgi:uncharacterized repeat protein (TIGR01451 family)
MVKYKWILIYMFRNIVSSLSLSPAATQQLAFYARRLKGENITRRLSFVMAGALLLLQIATIIAPATSANADSTNNIICSGINTSHPQKTLLDIYDANRDSCGHTGIREIFTHYGITRSNLANTTHGSTNSSNHNIKSLGRNPHSALDQTVVIGGQTYYQRPLYTWGDNINYPALVGHRSDGAWFAVLYGCGNLAIVDTTPTTGKPNVSVTKTLVQGPAAGSAVAPGTSLTFRIGFKNSGNAAAKDVVVGERLSDNTDFVSKSSLNIAGHTGNILAYHGYHSAYKGEPAGTFVYWKIDQLNAGGHGTADITVKVKAAAAPGSYLCDRGFIDTPSQSVEYSPGICHSVAKPGSPPPPPAPTPIAPIAPVTPQSSNIVLAKSAILVSADGSKKDANNAVAQPGDIIEYTLSTKNTGGAAEKDYVVSENINDVLEYADVLDPRGGTVKDGIITWPKTTIAAGQEFLTTFQVKVKSPLPATPTSVSDPQSFDLKLDNVYGNLVTVNLQPPTPGKQIEAASSNLPQTGPVTNVLTFAFIALVAYFYFRNRQLIKEISMLRNDYHGEV